MQDFMDMHLGLSEHLQQLESKREQIGEGILEVQRRIGILNEAMAWSPVEVEPYQEVLPGEKYPTDDVEDTGIQWMNR